MYGQQWWREKRIRIASQQHWLCKICGADIGQDGGDFHLDHIVERIPGAPVDLDGIDSDANCQAICRACHGRKTNAYQRRLPKAPRS